METIPAKFDLMTDKDLQITEIFVRERTRLGQFIRRRVSDPGEAEDILQDVLFEFIQVYRLPEPIEQVGAWLFRVARNRIIDRFRKKKEEPMPDYDDEDGNWLEQILPSSDAGPEASYARTVLLDELQNALAELPADQRDIFLAHELDGLSFKEMAAETGLSINTLLSRKRYAVMYLRERMQTIYNEFDF
jgi:RNA polymerase sigma factor (sigma-70 family)